MKNLAVLFFTILTLNCFGAGVTVSATNGFATGLTLVRVATGTVQNALSSSNLANTVVWNIRNIYTNAGMGAIATNITMQAGSTTLQSSNIFTAADVGKNILVYGVGRDTNSVGIVSTNCLSTTITAIIDAHTITLGASAPFGTTNTYGTAFVNQPSAVYGFDDSTNIQSFLNLVYSNGLGRTYFPKGIYVIANPIVDPNVGTNSQHINSQLYIPLVQGKGQWSPTLTLEGEAAMSSQDPYSGPSISFPGNLTLDGNATIFWSFYVPTNGAPQDPDQGEAMLTCKNYTNYIFMGGSSIGAYAGQNQVGLNGVHLLIKNMCFFCPMDPKITALDIRGCQAAQVENVAVGTGMNVGYETPCIHTNAYGIRFPTLFNPGNNSAKNFVVSGYWTGIELGEHIDLYSFWITRCYNAIQTRAGGHWCTAYGGDIEVCANYIYCYTNNYGGGNLTGFSFSLKGDFTVEGGGVNPWGSPPIGISDGNNNLTTALTIQSTSSGFQVIGGIYCNWILVSTNGTTEILQHQGWDSFANGISLGASRGIPTGSHSSSIPQYVFDARSDPFSLNSRFNNNSKQLMLVYESTGNIFFNTTAGGVASGYQGGGETGLNLIYGASVTPTNRLSFSSVSSLTNTLNRDVTAVVTAGTSVALQDTNGNAIATIGTIATLDVLVPMHVNMRLSGTGVSAILY